jgi:hypothetical protein
LRQRGGKKERRETGRERGRERNRDRDRKRETGEGVATPGDLIAPRVPGESRRVAGIISGKFQAGSRGLHREEATGKSVKR